MNWEKLFAKHILARGYDYYCENAVENLDIEDDVIRADVIGCEDYEVEISLSNGEVTDMYCSCPYATGGRNCKHMAAVLYEWSENDMNIDEDEDGDEEAEEAETAVNTDLFASALTTNTYRKKLAAIEKLVADAEDDVVRSFLVSMLAEDEKSLLCFYNTVNKQVTKEDINNYIRQVDIITNRYLGRGHFVSYYEARGFISELEDMSDEDVCRMIDNENYLSAFEVMNYIFLLIGDVDMDDSDGGTGMLADKIYQLWSELLVKVSPEDKKKMFDWFTAHLDGSVIDYLEEYIEHIIVEEFEEKGYEQLKLAFIESRIKKAESIEYDWSRDYDIGKWAIRYLELLKEKNASEQQIEDVCKKYWSNSSVRRYYIDMCMKKREYDRALQILDESILLDKQYRGLISEYSEKKKEIYLLQGNKSAYIEQLWELVLGYENRLYVHLSKDEKTAVKVGSRHGKPVLYHVFAKQMYEDGYKFFLSANGVWLTKEVPVKYLEKQ